MSRRTYQAVAVTVVILTVLIVIGSLVWFNHDIGRGPGN
jgi:hypothetical protein